MTDLTPLVTVKNLRKAFGQNLAVANVSFDVMPGEVFALLGPNGAGKTTTIRMMLDIFKPDSGSITILGGPLTPARADRIGYMPEERGLYPEMRVLDCLIYLGTLKGMTRDRARQRATTYLTRLGLDSQQRSKIKTLSRGMTQKVQVIAAIQHAPDLLIIDEPFANLDPLNAQLVRDLIVELRNDGKAVIMTSHQMALVESLCDRIALIHHGRVVLQGTIGEVRRQFAGNVLRLSGIGTLNGNLPGVTHVEHPVAGDWYLTLAPDTTPRQILQAVIASEHFTLDRFEIAMPTLDEIFVQVVRGTTQ